MASRWPRTLQAAPAPSLLAAETVAPAHLASEGADLQVRQLHLPLQLLLLRQCDVRAACACRLGSSPWAAATPFAGAVSLRRSCIIAGVRNAH